MDLKDFLFLEVVQLRILDSELNPAIHIDHLHPHIMWRREEEERR